MAEDKAPPKEPPAKKSPAEEAKPAKEAPAKAEELELITFKEFLESVPTAQHRKVSGVWDSEAHGGAILYSTTTPDLQLHCTNEKCNGIRFFRTDGSYRLLPNDWKSGFITYECSNCEEETKRYSLAISIQKKGGVAYCYKYGEMPPFGLPTPARLLKLIDPDRDIFLKGRQSENHGLGIGAFGYYRRVVENQKNRILDAIILAAKKLSAPPATIATLEAAKKERQFKNALDSVKDAVPPGLLINGQNPLTLLHSALSDGLHGKSDEVCLQRAHDIRLVLGELSERLAQAVKNEKELNAALGRLTKKKK